MTINEAQLILGLSSDATADEILEAYLKLIACPYPDNDSWPHLASRLVQAKALLLSDAAISATAD